VIANGFASPTHEGTRFIGLNLRGPEGPALLNAREGGPLLELGGGAKGPRCCYSPETPPSIEGARLPMIQGPPADHEPNHAADCGAIRRIPCILPLTSLLWCAAGNHLLGLYRRGYVARLGDSG
jgi:hypothetical protein